MRSVSIVMLALSGSLVGMLSPTPTHADDFGSFRRGTVRQAPQATESGSSVDAKRQWLKQQVMKVEDPLRRFQLLKQVAQMPDAQVNQVIATYQLRSGGQSESELARAQRRLREAQAYRDYLLRLRQQQVAGRAAPGFRPVITTLPSGVSMGASAVVSPDRRYVRIGVTPFFSQIGPVRTFNLKTGETRVISP